MDLLKRIGYYLVGLTMGAIAVLFFWKQKNVSFDYLPNARTLKNTRVKKRLFTQEALENMAAFQIDTATISEILKTGDVDFGKSKTHQVPCREYWINSDDNSLHLIVENCDSITTIQQVAKN